ncbi:MAG: NTP transferase domain-containing protein [Desulfobacteraceae bacterium]|nr:NTP transferase domain-containing protein [Desulfobacteraceae bacterium]
MNEMNRRQIGAIILSAGRSSRQNGFKPALAIGPHTALEHCLRLFAPAGLENVVAVLGHRADELLPAVRTAGARPVIHSDYDRGMFSSVQAGVAALPGTVAAFFVLPVDIPLVRVLTIHVLLDRLSAHPEADTIVPAFQDRTGHPPLIRAALRGKIAAHDGTRGLRGVLEQSAVVSAAVPDQHILVDIDTPAQYQRAVGLWQRHGIPVPGEARILLDWVCGKNSGIAAHSRTVAGIAEKLADEVNAAAGTPLDTDLVVAGALLHDIAKGQPDHAAVGASQLRSWGFAEDLASILACHADWDPADSTRVSEAELVYLADKLVWGARPVALDARFQAQYERFAGDPESRQVVMQRWQQAKRVCRRVEQVIGRPIDAFL